MLQRGGMYAPRMSSALNRPAREAFSTTRARCSKPLVTESITLRLRGLSMRAAFSRNSIASARYSSAARTVFCIIASRVPRA
jgi:hypothetical protein